MSKLVRRYSGDASGPFWRRVKALTNKEDHATAYFAGVLLQEMEERVLRLIENSEAAARAPQEAGG